MRNATHRVFAECQALTKNPIDIDLPHMKYTPIDPARRLDPEQVQALIAFVEAVRGHDFVTEPVVEFVDPATFEADVLANLAAEEPGIAPDEAAFLALDWIDASQDLVTEYRKAYGGGVVGYYDPVSDVLKVRGTSLTPYRREVIAHELTHALDDQIHDLSTLSSEGLLDAQYLSKLVAIEGSAERIRSAYYNSLSPLEKAQSLQVQLNAGSDPGLLTIPITLLTLTSAPYLRGLTFQNQMVAALGNPAGPDQTPHPLPGQHRTGLRHCQVPRRRGRGRRARTPDRGRGAGDPLRGLRSADAEPRAARGHRARHT